MAYGQVEKTKRVVKDMGRVGRPKGVRAMVSKVKPMRKVSGRGR